MKEYQGRSNYVSESTPRTTCKRWFRLTKWYSNEREVLATIPESERAKSVVNLDLEKLPTETALGLKWKLKKTSLFGSL